MSTNHGHAIEVKAAIITGVFAIIVALLTGIFFLFGALIQAGFIITAPESNGSVVQVGNPNAGAKVVAPPSSDKQLQSGCEWLQANFVQSPEAVTTQLNLTTGRVRMIYEACQGVANGFVIQNGPVVTVSVPEGGCIDAPPEARFTAATVPDGVGGLRAYSGEVSAMSMTYRPRC